LGQGLGAQGDARECDIDYDDGSGVEESCDRVNWCSHGGEDGWGCCRGTRDGLEEGGKRESDRSTTPSLRSFATTQRSAELLDHHALFEGARGSEVVHVFLGDHTFFSKPAGVMRSRAAICTVCFTLTEATWGTGLFERYMEGQVLFLCG
jgi:hypothetical protein